MDVREKLVELLTDNLPRIGNLPQCDNPLQYTIDEIVERIADHLIMNGVTVQEWISVKDRLPDKTGRYLVLKNRIAPDCLGGNRTDIVILRFFVDKGFRMPTHIPDWINEEINEEVTHWLPLPQPLKGE